MVESFGRMELLTFFTSKLILPVNVLKNIGGVAFLTLRYHIKYISEF